MWNRVIATVLVEENVDVDMDGSCFISTRKMAALIKKIGATRQASSLPPPMARQKIVVQNRMSVFRRESPSLVTPTFRLFLHHELDELVI